MANPIYTWVFIDRKWKWLYIWHEGLLPRVVYVMFIFLGQNHLSTYWYPLSTSVNLKNQSRNAGISSDVISLKVCRKWILVIVQKCSLQFHLKQYYEKSNVFFLLKTSAFTLAMLMNRLSESKKSGVDLIMSKVFFAICNEFLFKCRSE